MLIGEVRILIQASDPQRRGHGPAPGLRMLPTNSTSTRCQVGTVNAPLNGAIQPASLTRAVSNGHSPSISTPTSCSGQTRLGKFSRECPASSRSTHHQPLPK